LVEAKQVLAGAQVHEPWLIGLGARANQKPHAAAVPTPRNDDAHGDAEVALPLQPLQRAWIGPADALDDPGLYGITQASWQRIGDAQKPDQRLSEIDLRVQIDQRLGERDPRALIALFFERTDQRAPSELVTDGRQGLGDVRPQAYVTERLHQGPHGVSRASLAERTQDLPRAVVVTGGRIAPPQHQRRCSR